MVKKKKKKEKKQVLKKIRKRITGPEEKKTPEKDKKESPIRVWFQSFNSSDDKTPTIEKTPPSYNFDTEEGDTEDLLMLEDKRDDSILKDKNELDKQRSILQMSGPSFSLHKEILISKLCYFYESKEL